MKLGLVAHVVIDKRQTMNQPTSANTSEVSVAQAGPSEAAVRNVLALTYDHAARRWVSRLNIEAHVTPDEFHADPYAAALKLLAMHDKLAGQAIQELHKRLLRMGKMN